ncbi:Leukocyte receptor cluster member 9 [Gracilariopsis chorda]|uniref:Leukocyte receptor cluster member 9 n=1 Tax=Gracilariopsis chorda TaxID=448386 RepID=A0A2V3IPR3_9FLOR|nr:Leukocyte receptor cluster member 9 [Gracilariopsis chorda]|eukprot:PXF44047.1 Leukocyte receptor cluster member 9 [Gracilariopsis chorda]
MRSSRDVFNRLLHDESLNLAQDACVGYLDRFKGAMELSLPKFAIGEIPMHRVLYFRNGSEVIWHKETRLDLVYSSSVVSRAYTAESIRKRRSDVEQAAKNRLEMEEAARVKNYSSKRKHLIVAAAFSDLQNIPVHKCSVLSGNWISCRSCSAKRIPFITFDDDQNQTMLRVATFNVLQDTFLPKVLKQVNEVRWGVIIQHVKQQKAQIWVFTEATPPFADHLLSDEFIRENYFASDSPASSFRTLSGDCGATGQLVLMRRDLSVHDIFYTTTPLSTGKRLVFVSTTLPSGIRAVVCALHLTSGQLDRASSTRAIEKRHKQLEYVVSKMEQFVKGFDVHVVVGDFNFKSKMDDDANVHLLEGYTEADSTFLAPTYDTVRNGLAFLNAREPKSLRLDRVYIRNVSHRDTVTVQGHHVIGKNSIRGMEQCDALIQFLPSGLHASDHFGVVTTFQFGDDANPQASSQRGWTKSTALALLLEPDLEEDIDGLWRHKYDPGVKKWPAHINVLYPFVSEDCLDEVCSSIRDAMVIHGKRIPEYLSMEMDGVETFKHRSSSTVYLKPADDAISLLQELLFKTCVDIVGEPSEVSARRQPSYTPHMTIAKLKNLEDQEISQFVEKARADLLNKIKSLRTTKVQNLSVLRRIDGRMVTKDIISIPKCEGSSPMRRSLEVVRSLARRILGSETQYQVLPVGSSALLQNEACMDLDVVLLPSTGQKICSSVEFSRRMQSILPDGVAVRSVLDASCPIIIMDLQDPDYLPVDIMYGDIDFAHQAVSDSMTLLSHLKEKDVHSRSVYREALVQLKRWATSKQLTGKAFTLFPGISWSILLFSMCGESRGSSWKDWRSLLMEFFREYRSFGWKEEVVSINGRETRHSHQSLSGRSCSNDACVIVSPASRQNVACTVSRAVLKAFVIEADRALLALRNKISLLSWQAYLEAYTKPDAEFDDLIEINVHSSDVLNHDLISGWLKGKFASFVLQDLQTRGISVRPTDKIIWSKTSASFKGTILCGIDKELTTVESVEWQSCVRKAETCLSDKFLRWGGRPADSLISVTLSSLHL